MARSDSDEDKAPRARGAHRMTQVWLLHAHWKQLRILAAERDETASDFIRRAIRREIVRARTELGLDAPNGRAKKVRIRGSDE